MAQGVANSRVADCVKRVMRRSVHAALLALLSFACLIPACRAGAQIAIGGGSEPNPEIFFVPAELNPIAGFNPTTGALNGSGYAGDGQLANSSSSLLWYPVGLAYDGLGNLYFADQNNYVVRDINKASGGLLGTYAGTAGTFGFSAGNGTSPTTAQLGLVSGMASFGANLYFADRSNNVVWKVNDGGISIFAGGGTGTCANATDTIGDGCPALSAKLNNPWAVNVDASGNVYISDSYNDLVRVVAANSGIISVFAGSAADINTNGSCNTSPYTVTGPGPYLATQAHLCFPEGVAFDSSGNAYIADATRNQVLIVNSTGNISTFAGGGTGTCTGATNTIGDGCPATSATLHTPGGVFVDPAGRVYISDFFNEEIRVVDSTGTISSAMGSTSGSLNNYSLYEPDTEPLYLNGAYTGAVNGAYGMTMDPYGNLIVTDSSANAITSAGTTGQYVFGSQQIYTTVTTTSLNATAPSMPPYITIANPGALTLNFSGTPTVTGPFAITGGTCNFSGSLSPGQSCTVVASFSPTADQSYTGTVTINSNSNSSPNTILLSGKGIGTCNYSATLSSPTAFSSPPNVTTATKTATLTNTGVCPITVPTFSIVNNSPSGSSAFAVLSNNCPATLNGGATCTYNIDFTPTAVTSYSAQMQLNIPSYGVISSSLNGSGTIAPSVTFSPTSLTFASTTDGVTASAMSTVLKNVGNATLSNLAITLAGSNPSYFAFSGTNNCGTTLTAGSSCTISVNFTPTSALTVYSATISVSDNASGSPQTVALSGTGALPPVLITDNETIHTTDSPVVNKGVQILDAETIHTTDTPLLTPSKLILDAETIHTTDTPLLTPSKLILDAETIHTTDTPVLTPSKLILDAETIHTTDTEVASGAVVIADAEHITLTDVENAATAPFGSLEEAVDSVDSFTTVSKSDSVLVTGWVGDYTDGAPLSNVKVYIDGKLAGTPLLGIPREDVAAADGSRYLNSGFEGSYSASGLSLNTHSVTVIATDSRGLSTTLGPLTFNVVSSAPPPTPPFGNLEQAADSLTAQSMVSQSDSVLVDGWVGDAIDGAPLSNVKVYIDSTLQAAPSLGIPRTDVASVYGSRYLKSGFEGAYPASGLILGTHTVKVIATDSGGRSATFGPLNITVTSSAPPATPPFGDLEQALDAQTGQTTVSQLDSVYVDGWVADAVDHAPLSNVKVYIDGSLITAGALTLGVARPDVAAIYGSVYTDSGFYWYYPAASLSAGTHAISVVATDSGGRSTTLGPMNITVIPPPPFGNLEWAADLTTGSTTEVLQANTLWIAGWVADKTDGAPLSNVTVYIDGNSIDTPTLGIARNDVAAADGSRYLDSGYFLEYPASSLSLATHNVTVIAVDSLGLSTTFGPLSIKVVGP